MKAYGVALHFERNEVLGVTAGRRGGRVVSLRHACAAIGEAGLRDAVEQVLGLLGFDLTNKPPAVVAVLPRSVGVERLLDVPALGGEALHGLVAHELEAQLPWPLDEVWHGYTAGSKGGGRLHVLAAAVRKGAAAPYLEAIQASGASVIGLTLSDLALLGLWTPESAAGLCLLAPVGTAGLEAEMVCLAAGQFRFSRRVPLGDEADSALEVEKSLRFGRESLGLNIGQVAVAGGGRLMDCAVAGAQSCGASVATWLPDTGALPPAYWPALGAVAGLGTEAGLGGGLGHRTRHVPDLVGRRTIRPVWVLPVSAALLTLTVVSGLLWGYTAVLQRDLTRRQARLSVLKTPRTEAAQAAEQVAALEAELQGWRPERGLLAQRLLILDAVAGAAPAGGEFTGLTLSRDRLVDLTGRAPSAVAVVESLQKTPGLSGIALTGAVRSVTLLPGGAGAVEAGGLEEYHLGGGLVR